MRYLKNYNNFINESSSDEEVWTPIKDGKLPFLKSVKKLKSELNKNDRYPFYKTKKECDDYCDDQNELMYQNMDR